MNSPQQETAPFPCTPSPQRTERGQPQSNKEQQPGYILILQDDYPQSYILKLLDRYLVSRNLKCNPESIVAQF